MMEIKEFVASGIIEMYCLGIATDEEKNQVEKLAQESTEVRDEITAVSDALTSYAIASSESPAAFLKNKIMETIANSEKNKEKIQFPPRISLSSTAEEWLQYLSDNKISSPAQYDSIHLMDLPGNEKQVTYIAWAKKGAVVEESHDDEDEYLLMLKGYCSIVIDGKTGYYKAGDIVFIPKKSVHRAEILSDEPMLVIGQRIAA
jgi:quercetin dioxygenase-like cupin family protein